MSAEIKFCGLTRPEDACAAVENGAAYVGVIFAGGPRMLDAVRARTVLHGVPRAVHRVGVFGDQSADDIVRMAEDVELDIVQLHGEWRTSRVARVRQRFAGAVWAVVRVAGSALPTTVTAIAAAADKVVMDTFVPGMLGGTGVSLPWDALRSVVDETWGDRTRGDLVLAGGLRAENVGEALRLLRPGVVDVSSGVETAPGVKNHALMRAFRDAVRDY